MADEKDAAIARIYDLIRSRPPFCTKAGKLTTQGRFWDLRLRTYGRNFEIKTLKIIWKQLDAEAAIKEGAACSQ